MLLIRDFVFGRFQKKKELYKKGGLDMTTLRKLQKISIMIGYIHYIAGKCSINSMDTLLR